MILGVVAERIARHRGEAIGEENTKTVLIEPILRALGWDVEDLDEVRKEYRYKAGDNPVDYALFLLRTPRLYVEAKALGENLADRRWAGQIMGYAAVAGVEWVVLTDGNAYRIYNAGSSGDIDKKLFRRFEIGAGEPGVAETLTLLSKSQLQDHQIDVLWRAEKVDRQVKGALESLFTSEAPLDFVRLLRKRIPELPLAEVRASLGRARFTLDYPALEVASAPAAVRKAGPALPQDGGDEPAPDGRVDKTPWRHVTLQELVGAGLLRLPFQLEATYKGHQLTARIEPDATVTWNGSRYDSLSAAAGMARTSIIGAPPGKAYPQTNGWTFWRFRDADGSLVPLDVLRQRHFGQQAGT